MEIQEMVQTTQISPLRAAKGFENTLSEINANAWEEHHNTAVLRVLANILVKIKTATTAVSASAIGNTTHKSQFNS